ncbi:MAG: MFS transporter [Candidatus Hodarchaeota archaeon]
MDIDYDAKKRKTFRSLYNLYFMLFFCIGILPVNIGNLLEYLPGTTESGIGIAVASNLIMGTISIILFGYYGDKLSEKISRKKLFIITNLIWIIAYCLCAIALNYFFFTVFFILAAIGSGAFVPIGFSMISDLFQPKERGNKYGMMQFGLLLGNGIGIILGGLLGSYTGPGGWRYAYGLGALLGILTVIHYSLSGIEPIRASAEPEFMDIKGSIEYDYKLTINNLGNLLKRKSVVGILLVVLFTAIASSTLGTWAIFYLSTKIPGINAELTATTIYLLAALGSLPGSIIGGKFGDKYFHSEKINGRILISFIGHLLGALCLMGFYLIPFFIETTIQVILSWIFFLFIGFFGYMFASFQVGNQFAIYSEVCIPELRNTANAMNGLMVNIGGIIGNLLISFLIYQNKSFLPFALMLVLIIWLIGVVFWIIPYYNYPKEFKECKEAMITKRKALEKN